MIQFQADVRGMLKLLISIDIVRPTTA